MGLREAIVQGAPVDPRRRCALADWREGLGDEDAAALDTLIAMARDRVEGWNISKAHRLARGEGLSASLATFTRHADGECACGTR